MRTIGIAERRARLARRRCLAPGQRAPDVVAAARRMVCLHAADPATVYLSAWARVDGLSAAAVAARHAVPVSTADDTCCGPATDAGTVLRPEQAAGYVAVLKALADPHRLRMLCLIAGEPLCVCEIEGEFGLAQPTVSHHLKVLREAGLVTATRDGKAVLYQVAPAIKGATW